MAVTARRMFCISASSAQSECDFSAAGIGEEGDGWATKIWQLIFEKFVTVNDIISIYQFNMVTRMT
jgi:hypothetical protein